MTSALALPPAPPPHAADEAKLMVAIAAAFGLRVEDLDAESRARLRVMANACLYRLGADARTSGKSAIAGTLQDAGRTMRAAAERLDHLADDAPEAKPLVEMATKVEALAAVLLAMPDRSPPAPVVVTDEEAV